MKVFEETLGNSLMMRSLRQARQKNAFPIQLNGCVDTQMCHMMHMLGEGMTQKLIVTYSEERARKLYEDMRLYDRRVFYYPPKDVLFYNADVHGAATQNQRLEVVKALLEESPATVVTTIEAGLDRVLPLACLKHYVIALHTGQEISLDTLAQQLVDLGYESWDPVEKPGQFIVRGGILDVFPVGEEAPFRMELWGDEIDTIRSFDVESQRSIETLSQLLVYPATELPLTQKRLQKGQEAIEEAYDVQLTQYRAEQKNREAYHLKNAVGQVLEALSTCRTQAGIDSFITYFYEDTVSLLDYFAGEQAVIFYDEPTWIRETLAASEKEFQESMQGRLDAGHILPGQIDVFWQEDVVLQKMQAQKAYYFSRIGYEDPELTPGYVQEIHCQRTNTYQNHFELLVTDMQKWQREGYRILLLSASATRAKKLADEFEREGLNAYFAQEMHEDAVPGQVCVSLGNLSCGFLYTEEKVAVLSENDVVRRKGKKRRGKPRYRGEVIKSFDDLSVGDYVVHEDRGVGIYRGIVQRELDDVIKDYISIEYAGGDMYYINVAQMEKVQRYAGSDAHPPRLNKLGSKEWEKIKSRVRGQVGELAKELVQLYAIRRQKKGFACEPDTVWQTEFEEQFPYEETQDQLKAIAETKADMESSRIMDRLVCGDVGYGKTEIALRAAFKAVNNSKQVVYLVPTTVLAQQHYDTFTQRMKNYPVTVRMLSRFCTPKEQKETLEGLRKGEVDVVIGTHRVFSKDVEYKDLGLLIVDEEQRFGVAHKERIKQMKKEVDVLTLTATPIPRTLHMSLSGIRDMSLLNEAPVNRHAIQTYVMEYNEEMVREAIKREIARGGQVYYVFNRVKNIEEMAATIQQLVPAARVAYGHGQMSEHELERVMMDFVAGRIDVLVATTIIETGLDIPNVNTIIIHDADRFGLAQLYQLRGRVGRSDRRAFAFLLYRRDKVIQETAQKRLAAIREFTDLGSGFKIAMRDLQIRGAGNVLGEDQSGHLEAVGYDLYCKMLNEAIREMKGEEPATDVDTVVDVELTAYIPASYVRNEFQKLELYKRIATVDTREEEEDMVDELIDRYGELPEAAHTLLEIARLKNTASHFYITRIRQNKNQVRISMTADAPVQIDRMEEMLREYAGSMRFLREKEPTFQYTVQKLRKEEVLNTLWMLVDRIGRLFGQ